MPKDFYLIKMPHRWFKVLDTPKGMTWYRYDIIDDNIIWHYDSFTKGNKIMDYNPSIHDQMIRGA